MIDTVERNAIQKSLACVIREYVAAALEKALASLPRPERGEKGERGEVGPQGERGEKGDPGETVKGEKGEPGERGERGERGEKGEPGESIIGPKGDKGDPGASVTGPMGPRGEKGEPGESIQGPAGTPGRDGLQIDILPSVDLSRSYPRGTYARWDGGVIRSFRDTIPGDQLEKSGWEVVIAGVAEIYVAQGEDPRCFTVNTRTTGKQATAVTFGVPAMIYRDIYRDGSDYVRGDVVTWGGSTWHCQVDHPKGKPGSGGEWRLIVKEGQRGKDGKDGERGPQGPAGKDGRNFDGSRS